MAQGVGPMPLRPCSECQGEVAGSAKACPHCGNDLEGERQAKVLGVGCLVILGVILVLVALALVLDGGG